MPAWMFSGGVLVREKSNSTSRSRPLPPADAMPMLSGLMSRCGTVANFVCCRS